MKTAPRPLHLDKRIHQIPDVEGADDELLTTTALAEWLAVSTQFLEIGRLRGYGPPFTRVGPNAIRYRRGDVRAWLVERQHLRTSEYETHGGRPARKRRAAARAKRGAS